MAQQHRPDMQQVALVTGAADRLGAAMARALAGRGVATLIHYNRSAEKAETLAADLRASGHRAAAIGADLADRSARAGLVTAAAHAFGPLTLLVNNASIYEPDSPATLDETLWDDHFALHVEAPMFLSRDFAAQLPQGAQGNIVNLVDERVLALSPAYFSYTLSKAALWTATRTLAQALAPRIRVNAIGPGPTLPHTGQSSAAFAAATARLPLGRGPDPEEIARALLFLLDSPSVTGQMLAIDGGEHLIWRPERDPTPRAQ